MQSNLRMAILAAPCNAFLCAVSSCMQYPFSAAFRASTGSFTCSSTVDGTRWQTHVWLSVRLAIRMAVEFVSSFLCARTSQAGALHPSPVRFVCSQGRLVINISLDVLRAHAFALSTLFLRTSPAIDAKLTFRQCIKSNRQKWTTDAFKGVFQFISVYR